LIKPADLTDETDVRNMTRKEKKTVQKLVLLIIIQLQPFCFSNLMFFYQQPSFTVVYCNPNGDFVKVA